MIRSLFRPTWRVLVLLLPGAPLAHASDWQVVDDASSLRFSGSSQGESFDGRFGRFDANIRFDPAALDAARIDVRIALESSDTRNEERDETLHGADFFDVENYPEARFNSTDFAAVDAGFEARGSLELRGTSQPVTLAFTWNDDPQGARLDGRATLDRTAFGIGGGDWADAEMIAHEVGVKTTLVLRPQD
jgi:polyisoprenoid-binding protein YceI